MFKGSIVALITPFKNNKLDEDSYISLIHMHLKNGTSGLVPAGTTGESPTLNHKEHQRVIELCVRESKGKIPVIAGTGSNSTDEAISLTKFAEKCGADAALVVTPYYNKPTQEGLYQHFKAINDKCSLPIIIYNIPPRSVVDMTIDTMARLFELKNIIGVKDATGDLDRVIKQKEKMGPDFITIDGGEGGTGAAPLAFTDHVSLPFKVGFKRIYTIFQEVNLNNNITWIGSAQLGFPDRAIVAFAMGCDLINIARETMLSIGCIQARLCHTGHCPTGITTHNKRLQRGLAIESKSKRCTNFIKGLRKEILQLSHACGYEHPCQFTGNDIEFSSGVNEFSTLSNILGYEKVTVPFDASNN